MIWDPHNYPELWLYYITSYTQNMLDMYPPTYRGWNSFHSMGVFMRKAAGDMRRKWPV